MKQSTLIPVLLIVIGGLFILAGTQSKSPVTLIKENLSS